MVSNLRWIHNKNDCIKKCSHGWMRQGNFVDEWMLRWHSAMGHDSVTHGRMAGTGSGGVLWGAAMGGYPPRTLVYYGLGGPRWSRSAAGCTAAARCLHTGLTALITVAWGGPHATHVAQQAKVWLGQYAPHAAPLWLVSRSYTACTLSEGWVGRGR